MNAMFAASRPRRPGALLAALILGPALGLGCGDNSGLAKRFPIKGTVTYNSKPVETGAITFKADDASGRDASGEVVNGSYYLTTATDGDGALPGKYSVTIVSKNVDLSAAKAKSNSAALRQDDVAKANKAAKNLVPAKYSLPTTSGLKHEVTGANSSVNFDLTD